MKFVDPTQPYRKFGSRLFLKNGVEEKPHFAKLAAQSRSENPLSGIHVYKSRRRRRNGES
jgi:hypothetical protein